MKELIARLIRDYGAATTLVFNGTNTYRHTRAFLQLVTSKNWQNMERMIPTAARSRAVSSSTSARLS